MTPGSTVMVARDPSGDEEDRPLSLTIIEPKKPLPKRVPKPEPEKVGVGAKKDGDGDREPDGGDAHPSGDIEP
jgi:hypothetical protein